MFSSATVVNQTARGCGFSRRNLLGSNIHTVTFRIFGTLASRVSLQLIDFNMLFTGIPNSENFGAVSQQVLAESVVRIHSITISFKNS